MKSLIRKWLGIDKIDKSIKSIIKKQKNFESFQDTANDGFHDRLNNVEDMLDG